MRIAPSLLACKDWLNFRIIIEKLNDSEIDALHIDVMDGHFVPNIAFGPDLTRSVTFHSKKPLDIHLMISCLDVLLDRYIDIRPRALFIHQEGTSSDQLIKYLQKIKQHGIQAGIAINPDTSFGNTIPPDLIDSFLIMTVHPGFSGQTMIPEALNKITTLRQQYPNAKFWVDGGVKYEHFTMLKNFGVYGVVMGGSYFAAE